MNSIIDQRSIGPFDTGVPVNTQRTDVFGFLPLNNTVLRFFITSLNSYNIRCERLLFGFLIDVASSIMIAVLFLFTQSTITSHLCGCENVSMFTHTMCNLPSSSKS